MIVREVSLLLDSREGQPRTHGQARDAQIRYTSAASPMPKGEAKRAGMRRKVVAFKSVWKYEIYEVQISEALCEECVQSGVSARCPSGCRCGSIECDWFISRPLIEKSLTTH